MRDLAAICKYILIGKFSYTMPKVELIRNNFILQTQLSGGVKIVHFNSRHVYIDLDNELDYNMVWTKQRMSIARQVMRIQVWTPSFKPTEETPIVPIWIYLPELPWHCYNKEFVSGLFSLIGKVLYLNSASIKKTRGSQARVKKIEYDNIPDYCFYCKHQGHVESDCDIRKKDEDKKQEELETVRKKNTKEMDNNPQQLKVTQKLVQRRILPNNHTINKEIWNKGITSKMISGKHKGRGIIIHSRLPGVTPDKQNTQPSRQESLDTLETMDKHTRSKEVITGHTDTCIESMLPSPELLDNVVDVKNVGEEAVGEVPKGSGELPHVVNEDVVDLSSDYRSLNTPISTQKTTGQQGDIDTGQHKDKFNNKSGGRLSKKKRYYKKRDR
ncbi:hypothetical protein H5410_027608, partial [Solanum commersonii]